MQRDEKWQLIKEAKKGNIECYTCIFESVKPALYAKALKMFGFGTKAKDALQDTYLMAFSKLNQLKDPDNFNTWIHTILRNQCLLLKRSEKKLLLSPDFSPYDQSELQNNNCDSYLDLLKTKGIKATYLELISRLEEKKRAVVLLRFYSDFNSYKEIAAILNIPIGTVRSRLAQAKKELYRTISRHLKKERKMEFIPHSNKYGEEIREDWNQFYNGDRMRFLSHFKEGVQIRFSSGKRGYGLKRWADEWDVDLITGVRFRPNMVVESGNISVIEGPIINPPDKPALCPQEGGFVFYHQKGKVSKIHIHYADKKLL
jgi:RNA polymerase sigma factor (sigma-70 family)